MKCLVTGAGGFIGRYLVEFLAEAKHEVVGLGRGNAPGHRCGPTAIFSASYRPTCSTGRPSATRSSPSVPRSSSTWPLRASRASPGSSNQLARFSPGKPNSVCVSCTVDYNYILNYHRIGIEIQVSAPTDPILIEHNAVIDPINSSWGTFAVSLACCLTDRFMTTTGHSPSLIFDDNVLVASIPVPGGCPPYGVEFWGIGARGTNSLIEGTFCNGYTWGFGAAPWAIKGNYICGPNYKTLGGYISNQQKKDNPPEQSDNVVSPTCSARPSQAPQISPAGGSDLRLPTRDPQRPGFEYRDLVHDRREHPCTRFGNRKVLHRALHHHRYHYSEGGRYVGSGESAG